MDSPSPRYYFYCQSIGWGALTLLVTFFNLLMPHTAPRHFILLIAEYILPGLLLSQVLRMVIRHNHWLDLPFRRGLARILPALLLSVDHIQSLIDKDPVQSRNEITRFSQLLRNGYLKS